MPETVEAEIKRHQSEFRRLSNQLKSVADIKLGEKSELEQLRSVGDDYIDYSGVLRSPGEDFIDNSGTLRSPGEGFIDGNGIYRGG